MVAEGHDEADAEFLARLRRRLGPDRPIVATFDLHANLSEAMVAAADVLIGYDTFPHVDCGERGAEAAAVLARILETGVRPAKAFRKLPLISGPLTQATAGEPFAEILAAVREAEAMPGLLCCSVAPGFPYADVAHLGAAVVAYGDRAVAERAADR